MYTNQLDLTLFNTSLEPCSAELADSLPNKMCCMILFAYAEDLNLNVHFLYHKFDRGENMLFEEKI